MFVFPIISILIFMSLAIIWQSKDLLNIAIKVAFIFMTFWGIYFTIRG